MADKPPLDDEPGPSALIVDDEEYIRSSLKKMLEKEGYVAYATASGEEAVEFIKSTPVDVLLCDYKLPGINGIETIVEARKTLPDVASALITGLGTEQTIIDAFTKGRVDYYLMKPFTLQELTRVINMSLRAAEVRKRERLFNEELRKKVEEATCELREKNRLLVVREREMSMLNRMLKEEHERLKDLNGMLETLSITDELTGLYNFRHFTQRLMEEVARARRYGLRLSLLMMDLDNFKAVNDKYGHLAGDEALKKVAETIQGSSRSTDMAVRYGGEEFALILPEVGLEGAAFRAERLRQSVSEVVVGANGATFSVNISIGVASLDPEKMSTPHDFIQAADQALYHAKKIGKNCVVSNRDGVMKATGKENIMTESQRDDILHSLERFAKSAQTTDDVARFLLGKLKEIFNPGATEPFLSFITMGADGALLERARIGSYRGSADIEGLVRQTMASRSIVTGEADTGLVTCFPVIAKSQGVEISVGVLIMNRTPSYPPFVMSALDEASDIIARIEERERLQNAWSGRLSLDDALREMVADSVDNGFDNAFRRIGQRICQIMDVAAISLYQRGEKGGDFTPRIRITANPEMDAVLAAAEKAAISEEIDAMNKGEASAFSPGAEPALKKKPGEVIIIPLAEREPLTGFITLAGPADGAFGANSARMGENLAVTLAALLHHDPVFRKGV